MLVGVTLCVAFTGNAWAIISGEPIVWAENDNLVSLFECSGTRIGRNHVLTAAHCYDHGHNPHFLADAYHQYAQLLVDRVAIHPNYTAESLSEDVAIITLSKVTDVARIQFFKDLTSPTDVESENITIDGFAGTLAPKRANYTLYQRDGNFPFNIEAVKVGVAQTEGGDSGAAWVNQKNEIIAVHQSIGTETISATDLHFAADFILDTINGWHYPTIANISGHTTIEVQSLHRDIISDSAYTVGGAILNVEDSTCLKGPIKPFQRCTYVLESTGNKGSLYLSDSEVIRLKRGVPLNNGSIDSVKPAPIEDVQQPSAKQPHSKSGGSISFFALVVLLVFGLVRKKLAL